MRSRKVKAVAMVDVNLEGQSRKSGRSYQQVALRGVDSYLSTQVPLSDPIAVTPMLRVQGSPN